MIFALFFNDSHKLLTAPLIYILNVHYYGLVFLCNVEQCCI